MSAMLSQSRVGCIDMYSSPALRKYLCALYESLCSDHEILSFGPRSACSNEGTTLQMRTC